MMMTTTISNTNNIATTPTIKPVIKNKHQLLQRIAILKNERRTLEVELKTTLNTTIERFNPQHLMSAAVNNFKEDPQGGIIGKASSGLIDILLKNILANTKLGFIKKIALQALAPYAGNAVVNLIKNKLIVKKNITE